MCVCFRFNLSKPTDFNLRTLEFQVFRNCVSIPLYSLDAVLVFKKSSVMHVLKNMIYLLDNLKKIGKYFEYNSCILIFTIYLC